MNEHVKEYYRKIFKQLHKVFKEKNIESTLCENIQDANRFILSLIPPGKSVGYGGSTTLEEMNFHHEIRSYDVKLFDRMAEGISKQEKREIQKQSLTADYFITGANAVSMKGELFFIDGVGNRVAPINYGPDKVVVVTGVNKICPDEEYANKRMKFFSCPVNSIRLDLNTPCAKTGLHTDCRSDDRVCSFTLKVDFSRVKDRIHVVFINEFLGF